MVTTDFRFGYKLTDVSGILICIEHYGLKIDFHICYINIINNYINSIAI